MASKLLALTVFFGSVTIFLSILALSLNYWQGKTLLYKELLHVGDMVKGGVGGEEGGNVESNPEEEFNSQTTTGSISDMRKMLLTETGSGMNQILDTVFNIHGGIWHLCVKVIEVPALPGFVFPETCMFLQNIPAVYMPVKNIWVQADWDVPRSMLFLGMFCIVASVSCVSARWFMFTDKNVLLSVAAGLALVAGIFFVAGFSVFADTMKLEILDYQSAFYFCIFAWLLSWVTGGIIIYTRVSSKDLELA